MIQFNLLPDIKQQYLKAQRQKHLVVFISTIATIAAVALLVILVLVVNVWQKKSISDLTGDIKKYSGQLSGTEDLNKILTVQNQLNSLTGLHDKKAVATRLFDYVTKLTPANANIAKLNIDYAKNTITVSGTANALSTVNTYVDTLKFTKYKVVSGQGKSSTEKQAFSSVVLTAFGRTNQDTTYTIDAKFDPVIFSELSEVELTVPQITTTRSATEQPTDLFKQSTNGTN